MSDWKWWIFVCHKSEHCFFSNVASLKRKETCGFIKLRQRRKYQNRKLVQKEKRQILPNFRSSLPLKSLLRIRWIRKILASWIQGAKYQPKTAKKLHSTPNLNYWKKRDYKNFLISERFIKFYQKNKLKQLDKLFETLLC